MKNGNAVGVRIATYRKLRRMTQHQLVAAAEGRVSYSMLSKVEAGHASPSGEMIGIIARALKVDASRLDSDEQQEPTNDLDLVPVIRRALAAVDLMADDIESTSLTVLEPQVAQVMTWRRSTRYRKVAEVLPDLIDQLLVAARDTGEPAYALLTDAYRAANSLAHKFGYIDLSITATERMEWAANKSGDPLRLATTHFVKASTLARIGAAPQAMRLLTRAMADIEPLISGNPLAEAVASTLHMKAGTIAAALSDTDASAAHFTEAARLAAEFGDGLAYDTVVGPANVQIYRVAAETDLDRPDHAIRIAHTTRLPARMAKERQTHFWLDSARAHLLAGDPDAAIDALCESRASSPEHFRASPAVKTTVKAASKQRRRVDPTLQSLANSAGVIL
ncbi:helix-turn-helix domain-containing protein [Nocardia carnea]|uniref:helix-turn-helix domain-containing protein n=1 Tax=Nocardia carnea TaxID=37328 RepID=UPI002458ADD5|nr:helix-turn-helix domain-containing protein [Nocardia carnea]